MNRKLLNFILSGALLFGCLGFLSSCKDTSEDQFADLNSQLVATDNALKDQLTAANQNVTNLKNELAAVKQDLQSQIDALKNAGSDPAVLAKIAELERQINNIVSCNCDPTLKSQIDALRAEIENLKNAGIDPAVQAQINALKAQIEALQNAGIDPAVQTQIDALKAQIEALQNAGSDPTVQAQIDALKAQIEALQNAGTDPAILAEINSLKAQIEALQNAGIDPAVQAQIDALKAQIESLINAGVDPAVQAQIDALKAQIEALKSCECDPTLPAQLQALQDRLTAVETLLNSLNLETNKDVIANLSTTLPELTDKVIELEKAITTAGVTLDEVFNDPRLAKALELLDVTKLEEILKGYQVKTLPEALEKLITEVAELKNLEIPADLTAEVAILTGDVNNLKDQISTIQEALGQKADLSALEALSTKLNGVAGNLEALTGVVDGLSGNVNDLTGKVDGLEGNVNDLKATVEAYKAELIQQINTINDALNARVTELETKVDTLVETLKAEFKKEIERLEGKIDANSAAIDQNKQDIDQNKQDIDQNKQDIDQNKQDIDQNKQDIDQNKQDIADNSAAILENTTDINELKSSVKALKEALEAIVSCNCNCSEQLEDIQSRLTALETFKASMETLTTDLGNRVTTLENSLNKINDRLDSFNNIINSIVIQQVTNKVFGSLMLPLGIQTNILMAYYGENGSGITYFPSDWTTYEYNSAYAFDEEELKGVDKVSIGRILIDQSKNNAGTVYFTVNPSDVNLKGSVFSLVNSRDEACGMVLGAPKASDKLLMFGWSRAGNGFYCSNAYLPEANIGKCSLELGENLKKEIAKTAKEFLRDLRHLDRPDISQIAATIKNVLQKLNGQLPANAIKGEYQYKDAEGNTVKASAYSNYGIAGLSFQPQSFCFLEGQDNKFDKIPTIPTIDNFEFEMNEIKFDFKKEINVKDISLNIYFDKLVLNPEDITFTGYIEVNGDKHYIQDATVDGLDKISETINDKLEEIVGKVTDDVTKQVNDMVADINSQIEKMLDDMSAEVNSQLNDIMSDLTDEVNDQLDKYTNRINDLIKKANKLLGRVNNVLAHPNKYLQPIGIYTADNGNDMHILSTSIAAPSRFYIKGGNATTLYYTSYTLETIAPAYKKFVKVVNAWKNGDKKRATVASAVNNANAKGSLNKVTNGDQIRFAFAPEAGYTYEIVFQAVDYQGFTSTRRCFIEVR